LTGYCIGENVSSVEKTSNFSVPCPVENEYIDDSPRSSHHINTGRNTLVLLWLSISNMAINLNSNLEIALATVRYGIQHGTW